MKWVAVSRDIHLAQRDELSFTCWYSPQEWMESAVRRLLRDGQTGLTEKWDGLMGRQEDNDSEWEESETSLSSPADKANAMHWRDSEGKNMFKHFFFPQCGSVYVFPWLITVFILYYTHTYVFLIAEMPVLCALPNKKVPCGAVVIPPCVTRSL